MNELRNQLEKVKNRLATVRAMLTKNRRDRERAWDAIHHLHDELVRLHDDREELQKNIIEERKQPEPRQDRIDEWQAKLADLHKRAENLEKRRKSKEHARDLATKRAHHHIERSKWFVKRKTVLRRKIKKAKQEAQQQPNGQPVYQSWMANGHNDYVTQGVKNFIARGVVNYGLYCTSLKRTYVPPGGSTTSYHLQSPGRAGDIAGSRMQEFQINEYNRNKGWAGCLELFGPSNAHNLKYGNYYFLAEGSSLESLHDTHVHGAF